MDRGVVSPGRTARPPASITLLAGPRTLERLGIAPEVEKGDRRQASASARSAAVDAVYTTPGLDDVCQRCGHVGACA